VSRCFAALRQLRRLRCHVTNDCLRSLLVSLVHSRLDYGNFVFDGLAAYLQRRLQYSTPQLAWYFDFVAMTTCLTPSRYCTGCVCHNRSTLNCMALMAYRVLNGMAPCTISESTRSGIKPAMSSPSAVVVHAAAALPAVPSVNSRLSLVSFCSLHFLEHSARRRAVCTVCFFLPATTKDIPVLSVISRHHSLNFRTTLSWTLQQFRLF